MPGIATSKIHVKFIVLISICYLESPSEILGMPQKISRIYLSRTTANGVKI